MGRSALGELDNAGSPKWAVIFEAYNIRSIRMHIAIADPKYVTRRAIAAVFEYPFRQLDVKKVITFVDSSNKKALFFNLRLGLKIEATVKDAYEMGDMYILSMTQNECHWLRGISDGRFSHRAAAA